MTPVKPELSLTAMLADVETEIHRLVGDRDASAAEIGRAHV